MQNNNNYYKLYLTSLDFINKQDTRPFYVVSNTSETFILIEGRKKKTRETTKLNAKHTSEWKWYPNRRDTTTAMLVMLLSSSPF